jgi:hypothetical protein
MAAIRKPGALFLQAAQAARPELGRQGLYRVAPQLLQDYQNKQLRAWPLREGPARHPGKDAQAELPSANVHEKRVYQTAEVML